MAKHADLANIAVNTGKPATITLKEMSRVTDTVFRDRANFVRAEAARLGRDPSTITISNAVFSVMLADSPAAAEASAREIGQMLGIPAREAGARRCSLSARLSSVSRNSTAARPSGASGNSSSRPALLRTRAAWPTRCSDTLDDDPQSRYLYIWRAYTGLFRVSR